jgi:hypothetical protein
VLRNRSEIRGRDEEQVLAIKFYGALEPRGRHVACMAKGRAYQQKRLVKINVIDTDE